MKTTMLMEASNGYKKHKIVGIINKYKMLYVLLLPGLLFFIIFSYVPMYGIVIAFQDYNPVNGIKGIFQNGKWVGFEHFIDFFKSYYFVRILKNTIEIFFLKFVIAFPAPIILAILLNEVRNRFFKRFVQTVSYMPHFLSIVIITSLAVMLVNPTNGVISQLIESLGGKRHNFLTDPVGIRVILVVMNVWATTGWSSILYLAAFSGINPELTENASIEGANKFQLIRFITLPSISYVISITLIISMGSILSAGFEDILLLYNPAVYSSVDVIDTFIYREGLVNSSYSYATAVGFFRNGVGLMMVLFTNYLAKKLGSIGIW
jgi:putative aldouronate transport system permease protein